MQDSRIKLSKPLCPLCNSQYDQYYKTPRVIPKCGHSFCQKCITNKIQTKFNRKVFLCSECSSQTIIRKNVADQIPKNISIIDIIKNMKKQEFQQKQLLLNSSFCSNEKKSSIIDHSNMCKVHNKQKDLICQTCNNQRICSHCLILKGIKLHQNHKLVDRIAASDGDIQDLKQTFSIIQDSIRQTILPEAPQNIIRKSQQMLLNGLKQVIHEHFKQYHKIIQKKQAQVMRQCQQIKVQGQIQKSIDKIIKNYQMIKFSFDDSIVKKQNRPSLDFIQEFVKGCKNLHNQMVELQDYVQAQSKRLLLQLTNKISQSVQFKIQQISFSLKNVLENKLQSPKKINNLNAQQHFKDSKSIKNLSEISKIKQENQYSSFQFINKINQNSKLKIPPKQKVKIQQTNASHQSIQQHLSTTQIPSLDLKKSQKKNVKSSFATQRVYKPSKQNQLRKKDSLQKPSESFDIISSRVTHISSKSQKKQQQNQKVIKLKQVRPTKQIAFQLKNKFQAVINQIDRQSSNSTLQLIGMQINDAILMHIIQYLRAHKLKFVMIKLVKNAISDQGLSYLLSYLCHDDQTQVLNLTSNNLSAKCLELIVQFGERNSFLKTIYLTNNKVSVFQLKNKRIQFQKNQTQVII